MTSHNINMKHPDMRLALEKISSAIKDAQQRRDHYKRMSPKQRVSLPDRFGVQVFDADQMAWLYQNEHDVLQKLYEEVYGMFTIRSSRPLREPQPASAASEPPSSEPALSDE